MAEVPFQTVGPIKPEPAPIALKTVTEAAEAAMLETTAVAVAEAVPAALPGLLRLVKDRVR